jgi:ABC-type antimicrobial peptide transport system permease subunit
MKAALVAIGIPVFALLCGSVLLFAKEKSISSFLQVVGAGSLVIVVVTHICETLGLFAWMHWGLKSSVAHYLDFWSAALGLTLFCGGYLFHSLTHRHAQR